MNVLYKGNVLQLSTLYQVDRYLSSAFGGRRGGEQRELYSMAFICSFIYYIYYIYYILLRILLLVKYNYIY